MAGIGAMKMDTRPKVRTSVINGFDLRSFSQEALDFAEAIPKATAATPAHKDHHEGPRPRASPAMQDVSIRTPATFRRPEVRPCSLQRRKNGAMPAARLHPKSGDADAGKGGSDDLDDGAGKGNAAHG